jgi:hypothetical protein
LPRWPETVEALREAFAGRPKPGDEENAGPVFLTQRGWPWIKFAHQETEDGEMKVKNDDSISKETAKVLKALGTKKTRLNFYTLRHVVETIGGEPRARRTQNAKASLERLNKHGLLPTGH